MLLWDFVIGCTDMVFQRQDAVTVKLLLEEDVQKDGYKSLENGATTVK